MNCIYCGSERIRVDKTINKSDCVIRHRQCISCKSYFTTIEINKPQWDKLNKAIKYIAQILNIPKSEK